MPTLSRSREGVSPVIAVILLVAITVVLASVVYIMVSNIVVVPPGGVARLSATAAHTGGNWTIIVTTATTGLYTDAISFFTRGTDGAFVIAPVKLANYTGHFSDQDPVGLLNPSDSVTVPYATHPRGSSFTFATGQSVLFEGMFSE